MFGIMTSPCLIYIDVMKYHVNITSVDTISRFCGAMSKKIFDSVSQYGNGGMGEWVCVIWNLWFL